MTGPDLHRICGRPLIQSDSHPFFLSVGSGVFSASSEADDSDHLHGRSFNRSHHLRWSLRQVKRIQGSFRLILLSVFHRDAGPWIFFRFGRRSVLIWSYLQLAILGCSAALSPTYTAYCILRFLCGLAVSGIIINGVSLSKHTLFLCF